jgi:hypothetical protein
VWRQLEELDQIVVGRLNVLVACIGSKAQTTEQLFLELGHICTSPQGCRLTTHVFFPSFCAPGRDRGALTLNEHQLG